MNHERYEALKRLAAPGSGASDNERAIALGLLAAADRLDDYQRDTQSRIDIRKGVSGSSFLVTRKDGRGGCTMFMPISEGRALNFVGNSLRLNLNRIERRMVCEKVNS